jgi:hypothetical protein
VHPVTRTALVVAALGVAAAVLPVAPASAYCNEARPCETECDRTAATFDQVVQKAAPGAPRYHDFFYCPQN